MQTARELEDERYLNKVVNDTYLIVSRTPNYPRFFVGKLESAGVNKNDPDKRMVSIRIV